ncbi:glycosyltransferase family 4 protein [soil metagenome]
MPITGSVWPGVLAVLASAALTAAWIALARRRGIHDSPGQRRLHSVATPRGGGIAIAIVLAAGMVIWSPVGSGALAAPWWGLATGISLFALVGLVDDLRPLPALAKFGGQWIAAAVLAWSLVLGATGASGWLVFALIALAAVYFVNIWNFMDGSNGLVAVQSILVALALACWPGQDTDLRLLAVIVAGAGLGFLPFNLPKARVFLGDVGSHVLGAALFGLLYLSWRRGVIGLPAALMLPGAMLADSALTLARRAWTGRAVWKAHREHLYQYAVRSGHSHLATCMAYAAWTAAWSGVALALDRPRSSFVTWFSFTLCFVVATVIYVGLRRRWLKPRKDKGTRYD